MGNRIPLQTQTWTCLHCGVACERPPTKGQKPKFCGAACRRQHTKVCEDCNTAFVRSDARWCARCRTVIAARPKATTLVQCAWCHALHAGITKFCSDSCRANSAANQGSQLKSQFRLAYEARDAAALLTLIEARVTKTPYGCWDWDRIKDGYPMARVAGKEVAIHRLVIELSLGQPLGSQAAHHICANSACVNPEHLQPVTFRENTAEMMARHAYLNRISELEEALRTASPNHPVLNVVPVR